MKGFMHALKKKKSEKKSKSESSSSRSSNNNASFTKSIVHNCCVQFCSVPFHLLLLLPTILMLLPAKAERSQACCILIQYDDTLVEK